MNGMPTGYRFCPTDEELVNGYLKNKMIGNEELVSFIAEIDIYKHDPWELRNYSTITSKDKEWYFFCPCAGSSGRSSRKTKTGFWKVTGQGRSVKTKIGNEEIAVKRTVVFYDGRVSKGAKRTGWIMHEYQPKFQIPNQRNFVICKIKWKSEQDEQDAEVANATAPSSSSHAYESESSFNEERDQMHNYLESFRGWDKANYSLDAAMDSQVNNVYDYGYPYM